MKQAGPGTDQESSARAPFSRTVGFVLNREDGAAWVAGPRPGVSDAVGVSTTRTVGDKDS